MNAAVVLCVEVLVGELDEVDQVNDRQYPNNEVRQERTGDDTNQTGDQIPDSTFLVAQVKEVATKCAQEDTEQDGGYFFFFLYFFYNIQIFNCFLVKEGVPIAWTHPRVFEPEMTPVSQIKQLPLL